MDRNNEREREMSLITRDLRPPRQEILCDRVSFLVLFQHVDPRNVWTDGAQTGAQYRCETEPNPSIAEIISVRK